MNHLGRQCEAECFLFRNISLKIVTVCNFSCEKVRFVRWFYHRFYVGSASDRLSGTTFTQSLSALSVHRSVCRTLVRWTPSAVSLWPLMCSLFAIATSVVCTQTLFLLLSHTSIVASESLTPTASPIGLFLWKLLFFATEVNFSEPRLRPKRGKKLFSTCSWVLMSFPLVHRHAFMKDFLKLSLWGWFIM